MEFYDSFIFQKKCSNNLSTIEKNSSSLFLNYIKKEEKQKNKNIILPSLASDLKYSYSYYKPIKSQKSFEIENKIIQSKYKLLAEKRSLESINKTINEFGFNRAKLKENINNKHEIKNLIKMYVNNQDKEGLNITSPLLKKYLVKKKEILSKPVCTKREREQSTNKIRNFSTSNILEKYRKKIKKNIIEKIPNLPINSKQLENNNKNKEKIVMNSYIQSKIIEKNNEIKLKMNKIHLNNKRLRLFYGINHTKIFMDKIQNIDKETNMVINNKKIQNINIYVKLSNKIKKNGIKDNMDNNNTVMDISTQLFSSEPLFEQRKQYFQSLNINKYQKEKNNKDILNRDINKEDLYTDEIDSYYNHNDYHLSAFHKNNLEKLKNSRNENKCLFKGKSKSVDFNEYRKNEIENNFKLFNNNFLFMRKNLASMKKREFEELKNKMRNIKFKYNNRYDNIDEDKVGKEFELINNNYEFEKNKKFENLLKEYNNNINNINDRHKVENSLSKALLNPNDNFGYLLYYYPRPGSKLLIKK